ncbi:aldo/keto reductase [Parvibaculum sp. MBR-TMA-1.3b-4.2]|jgi:diketogulonate reductase-like aldo/keto reductase
MKIVEANSAKIPAIGLGTYRLKGEDATRAVTHALEIGYRHIDTAQMYDNEEAVGKGIAAAPVAREEVFLTTKIWPDNFSHGDLIAAAKESIARLKTDYVDLLLLHWPSKTIPLKETMLALNEVQAAGIAKHIGISNFTTSLIEEAASLTSVPLTVDQVEYHPYLPQDKVLSALRAHGMALTAYAPLAHAKVSDDKVIQDIAKAHGKTPGQIALRWLVQQDGVIAIPKSGNPERQKQNIEIFDFELSDDEMARLFALQKPKGRIIDPAGIAPEWDAA